jgi:hypothetical protein
MNFSFVLLFFTLGFVASSLSMNTVTLTTFVTSTITVTTTEYVTVYATKTSVNSGTVSATSTTFKTRTKTKLSTVTSTQVNSSSCTGVVDIDAKFTTTVTGPASQLPGSFDFDSLEETTSIARVGTIYSYTDYEAIVSGKVKGICGLKVNPLAKYWVAISTKYLHADPVYYPNPNVHPLCSGTICVEVFGPNGRMVGQIFDSFDSFNSSEDIIIAGTSFELLGYTGSVGETTWRFIPCPKSNGLGVFQK